MGLPDGLDEVSLRAYFASVIGVFRAPFGARRNQTFTVPGQLRQIASNDTPNRVLSVFVSRNDAAGNLAVTFSQGAGGAATTDFAVAFAATSIFRFILKPSERLSMTLTDPAVPSPMTIVIAEESY